MSDLVMDEMYMCLDTIYRYGKFGTRFAVSISVFVIYWYNIYMSNKKRKQAGAELSQAQVKLC